MNTEARTSLTDEQRQQVIAWSAFGGLLLLLIWGYWNSLSRIAGAWNGAQYSHGYLIPLFAAVLMFIRREKIGEVTLAARWTGVALLTGSMLVRCVSSYFSFIAPDNLSFISALAGVLLIVGGWRMMMWAGPAVGFLLFMIPWPMALERVILGELGRWATILSTFAMQTLGMDVYRVGNTIMLEAKPLNVVDACSGLRMATILCAMTVAVVLITSRPWWERVVLLASAIPLAIAANVVRIVMTGLCYHFMPDSEVGPKVFHDLAGFIMMPIGLVLLFFECAILQNLFIDVESKKHVQFGRRGPRPLQTTILD